METKKKRNAKKAVFCLLIGCLLAFPYCMLLDWLLSSSAWYRGILGFIVAAIMGLALVAKQSSDSARALWAIGLFMVGLLFILRNISYYWAPDTDTLKISHLDCYKIAPHRVNTKSTRRYSAAEIPSFEKLTGIEMIGKNTRSKKTNKYIKYTFELAKIEVVSSSQVRTEAFQTSHY